MVGLFHDSIAFCLSVDHFLSSRLALLSESFRLLRLV